MSLLKQVETIKLTKTLPPIIVMLEGSPKTGKTTQALTWPKPLLLDFPTEDGAKFHPGARRFMVEDFSDIERLGRELKGSKDYQTVIVDTADAAWELLTGGQEISWQQYGDLYARYLRAIKALVSAGKHVVITAHVKKVMEEYKDDRGKKQQRLLEVRNMLPGQLSQRLAGMVDHILHAVVDDDGGYNIQCHAGKKREAGGRLRCLPTIFRLGASDDLFAKLETAYANQGKDAPAADYSDPSKPTPEELEEWSDAAA